MAGAARARLVGRELRREALKSSDGEAPAVGAARGVQEATGARSGWRHEGKRADTRGGGAGARTCTFREAPRLLIQGGRSGGSWPSGGLTWELESPDLALPRQ